MFIADLRHVFLRDLRKLANEVNAYADGADLWRITGQVANSGGNLCLHLCGNLQHFIGNIMGGSSYVRNREREFAVKDVPKADLLDEVNRTIEMVDGALARLDPKRLDQTFPVRVMPEDMTTAQFLLHLHGHLNYHLGQINYLRRSLPPR